MIDNVNVLIRRGFRIPVAVLSGKSASSIGLVKTKKLIKKNGKKSVSFIHSSGVDNFLSHHGVKGQKWGVRQKRIATGLAIGGTIAATAFVSSILSRKGMVPVSQLHSIQASIKRASIQTPQQLKTAENIRGFLSKF